MRALRENERERENSEKNRGREGERGEKKGDKETKRDKERGERMLIKEAEESEVVGSELCDGTWTGTCMSLGGKCLEHGLVSSHTAAK